MINVRREGTRLVVTLEHGLLGGGEQKSLKLEWDASTELLADALTSAVRDHLIGRVERVRKLEYEAGYKDGRQKKPKRSWFYSSLVERVL